MRKLMILQLFVFLLLSCNSIYAQENSRQLKDYNLDGNLAIQGYDPVAYFTEGRAREGKPEINVSHEGIKYYFRSEKNKQIFTDNPEKYEPAYGGWCAYAMGSDGSKVKVDPETFKIIDNRLYLFYNFYFNNTLKSWNADEKALKVKADNYWNSILTDN